LIGYWGDCQPSHWLPNPRALHVQILCPPLIIRVADTRGGTRANSDHGFLVGHPKSIQYHINGTEQPSISVFFAGVVALQNAVWLGPLRGMPPLLEGDGDLL
jgi:hypothetical protein